MKITTLRLSNVTYGRRRQGVLCNETIVLAADRQDDVALEGCLSYPGAAVAFTRPDFAVCRGQGQFGNPGYPREWPANQSLGGD